MNDHIISNRITRKDLELKAHYLTELLQQKGELSADDVLKVDFYSYRFKKYNLIRTNTGNTSYSNVSDCMTNQEMWYYLSGAIRALTQGFGGRTLW